MSSFTDALDVEFIDGTNWRVIHPFVYDIGDVGSGQSVVIPAGFITDFASIPRGLWNILPPTGGYGKAAVVHDYLYRGGYITTLIGNVETHKDPTRAETDGILKEAMAVSNVDALTRWTIWAGVRVGGHFAWTKGHDVRTK